MAATQEDVSIGCLIDTPPQPPLVWVPSYPGQTYKVPYYVDSDEDECVIAVRAQVARQTALADLNRHTFTATSNMVIDNTITFPSPTDVVLSSPGIFVLRVGKVDVRVFKGDDNVLLAVMGDCLESAGASNVMDVIRRLSKKHGRFSSRKLVYDRKAKIEVVVGSFSECIKMLGHYVRGCRKNKYACYEVVSALTSYIK